MSAPAQFVHKFDTICPRCGMTWGSHVERHEVGFHCNRPFNPIEELASLLREAGLVPYLHKPDCGTWNGFACNEDCGPTQPSSTGEGP